MAFEKLYDFIDQMAEKHSKSRSYAEELSTMQCLVIYYETVLHHAKFVGQRAHCMKTIFKIAPSFAIGYFGKNLYRYIDKDEIQKWEAKIKEVQND